MKTLIVAVRDRVSVAFMQPNFVGSKGGAIRAFADAVNSRDEKSRSMIAQHPEDFDLFLLGSYDDETGLFDTGVPQQIAVGKDLLVKDN